MPRYFKDNTSWPVRAQQIWQILVGKAHNRQTMTYGELAKLLGYSGAGVLSNPLDLLLRYCAVHQLPPLTCLVVNQETGLPGEGLVLENLHGDRERVYQFAWYSVMPPTVEELEEAKLRYHH